MCCTIKTISNREETFLSISFYYSQNSNGNHKMKQNMQNQTISELHTDDKKSKYSSNPNDIFNSAKNFYKKGYTKETTSKTLYITKNL